jgi:translation initiation factor IF-3
VIADDGNRGVYDINTAIKMAQDEGLDLVEISPAANPPVCRIIDYSKYKYEQKKKQKEIKAKTQRTVIKEIRFGPNTDDHDFNFKLKHAENFLHDGAKVKAYVHFVGRTIVFKERGELLLLRFAQALEEVAKVDQMPKLEGKRMILMLSPKGKIKDK